MKMFVFNIAVIGIALVADFNTGAIVAKQTTESLFPFVATGMLVTDVTLLACIVIALYRKTAKISKEYGETKVLKKWRLFSHFGAPVALTFICLTLSCYASIRWAVAGGYLEGYTSITVALVTLFVFRLAVALAELEIVSDRLFSWLSYK